MSRRRVLKWDGDRGEWGGGKCPRHQPNPLAIMSDTTTVVHRELICSLADRYRLPTVYPYRFYIIIGGLMSYGIDLADEFRGAASYVDLILRGKKANELPVQLPTKFELTINLKTARALGLTIPPTLLATADEVIE